MGQWNMCVRRGDTLSMHVHYFFFPHSHVVFVGPHKHRIPMDPQYKGVQQDSKQALANSELGGAQGEEAAIAETQRTNFLPEACKALLA